MCPCMHERCIRGWVGSSDAAHRDRIGVPVRLHCRDIDLAEQSRKIAEDIKERRTKQKGIVVFKRAPNYLTERKATNCIWWWIMTMQAYVSQTLLSPLARLVLHHKIAKYGIYNKLCFHFQVLVLTRCCKIIDAWNLTMIRFTVKCILYY